MTDDEWKEMFTAVLQETLVPQLMAQMQQVATDAAIRVLNRRQADVRREVEDILASKRLRLTADDD